MDRLAAMEAFVLWSTRDRFLPPRAASTWDSRRSRNWWPNWRSSLGVKRLVRTTQGLTETQAGLNYYERARRSIEEADEGELAPVVRA
jgi:hypothetical protein